MNLNRVDLLLGKNANKMSKKLSADDQNGRNYIASITGILPEL
jgi:hypothetical protein